MHWRKPLLKVLAEHHFLHTAISLLFSPRRYLSPSHFPKLPFAVLGDFFLGHPCNVECLVQASSLTPSPPDVWMSSCTAVCWTMMLRMADTQLEAWVWGSTSGATAGVKRKEGTQENPVVLQHAFLLLLRAPALCYVWGSWICCWKCLILTNKLTSQDEVISIQCFTFLNIISQRHCHCKCLRLADRESRGKSKKTSP